MKKKYFSILLLLFLNFKVAADGGITLAVLIIASSPSLVKGATELYFYFKPGNEQKLHELEIDTRLEVLKLQKAFNKCLGDHIDVAEDQLNKFDMPCACQEMGENYRRVVGMKEFNEMKKAYKERFS